jgi:hypothetical protein
LSGTGETQEGEMEADSDEDDDAIMVDINQIPEDDDLDPG